MSEKFNQEFAKYDADGSGTIDLNEAKAFVAAIGAGIPDSKVEEYFKKYDTDGNGSLDKDECLKLVKDIFPEFQ